MKQREKGKRVLFARVLFIFSSIFSAALQAQVASIADERASATVWVYIEQTPGNEPFSPGEELKNLAAFVLSGLVFGWRFEYTPSYTARGVQSYFLLEPLGEITPDSDGFSISSIEIRGIRLYCRAEFIFDETALNSVRLWNSVLFNSCTGRGFGSRSDEITGVLTALESAVQNAIHEHARKLEKNRPKEIRGEIKFKEEPRLSAASGRFIADAKFLINVKEIIPYTAF